MKRKKKMDPFEAYLILFFANSSKFIDSLSVEKRSWLIEDILRQEPECICCPCFAWEDDYGRTTGCICTLGGEPNPDGKGICGFAKANHTCTKS
jgi:hypothetical protein